MYILSQLAYPIREMTRYPPPAPRLPAYLVDRPTNGLPIHSSHRQYPQVIALVAFNSRIATLPDIVTLGIPDTLGGVKSAKWLEARPKGASFLPC